MQSISTQTPRSSFPQMSRSLLYPNSELHDVIDVNKGSIKQQKKNLKIQKEKLANNVKEVEEQLQKVLKQSGIVQDLEEDFRLMDSLPIFQMHCEFKEVNSQRSILAKFGADLKQQIDFVESELDEATYQLKQAKERAESGEPEEVDTIHFVEQKIREQEIQLKELRSISNALNTEVLSRENEVIQLEMQASKHLKEIKEAKELKNQLTIRKYEALHKKELYIKQSQENDKKNHDISQKLENARVKLSLAQNDSIRLNLLEKELDEKEKLLKAKSEELIQLHQKRSQNIIKETNKKIKRKEKKEMKQLHEMRCLAKEEDELLYEINEMEFQLDNDQKEFNMKSDSLSITKDSKDKAFNSRKTKLIILVDDMKERLKNKKTPEELQTEIQIARQENDKISKETEDKRSEISEIKKKLTPDEKVDEMKKELQKQMKSTLIQEREINSKLGAIKAEEREATNDEEEMKRSLSLIEAEISLTKKNDSATSSMLKICREQTETLRKRYEIYLEAQRIEKSNSNDGNVLTESLDS